MFWIYVYYTSSPMNATHVRTYHYYPKLEYEFVLACTLLCTVTAHFIK